MTQGRSTVHASQTWDADGRPVVTIGCDCGTTTVATIDVPTGQDFALTCDGCLTVRWMATIALTEEIL